jgi:hypothetical protein
MITYDELKKTTAKGATLLKVDDSVLTVYGVFDDEAGKYAIFEDETHALRRAHADYLGVFDDLAFSCAENSNYQDETTDSFQAYLDAKRKEQGLRRFLRSVVQRVRRIRLYAATARQAEQNQTTPEKRRRSCQNRECNRHPH